MAMQVRYLLLALPPALVLTVVWQLWTERQLPLAERFRDLRRRGWLLLFLVYLFAMLGSALLDRPETDPTLYVTAHLWFNRNPQWNIQIIENILFFIPYSLLFLLAFRPRRPWLAALLASFAVTVLIEGGQLVFRRGAFQLSDMIYNTLGGLVGCGIRQLGAAAVRRWRKKRKIV